MRQKAVAYARAVFNVAFNNRDDHAKNFAYLMSKSGVWTLAPAYDVTFCEGPNGYHQMDVMGAALNVRRKDMIALGTDEAELSAHAASAIVDQIRHVASTFTAMAKSLYPDQITNATLQMVQGRINDNIKLLR